jgi:UTP--glucose-1-phosphate uridylyltransferase
MKITKAVITAAGADQRSLPLQTLIDLDGQAKTALEITVEEAASAGVEELAIIVHPGDHERYASVLRTPPVPIQFIEQPSPRGYGHALHCASEFAGGAPFLHLVSDHLCVSRSATRCAQQLVEIAERESAAVSAVQSTRESALPLYGAVGGSPVRGRPDLYEVQTVLEKPTPTLAEEELAVPGLRAGNYLCFFGLHVITPAVLQILEQHLDASSAPVALSPALAELAGRERYLALEIQGQRYNLGIKYGLFLAQLALILKGDDRENVLAQMVELLAVREGGR